VVITEIVIRQIPGARSLDILPRNLGLPRTAQVIPPKAAKSRVGRTRYSIRWRFNRCLKRKLPGRSD